MCVQRYKEVLIHINGLISDATVLRRLGNYEESAELLEQAAIATRGLEQTLMKPTVQAPRRKRWSFKKQVRCSLCWTLRPIKENKCRNPKCDEYKVKE